MRKLVDKPPQAATKASCDGPAHRNAASVKPGSSPAAACHDFGKISVYPAEPGIMGPYLLPEVVITAESTPSVRPAARDVTFVKVSSIDLAIHHMEMLNQQAEAKGPYSYLRHYRPIGGDPRQELRSRGTISDPVAEAKAEYEKAQQALKEQFGEFWGTVFWWTRGGGQTGEDSPLWQVLDAAGGLHRGVPPERYPTAERVYPTRLPATFPKESTK